MSNVPLVVCLAAEIALKFEDLPNQKKPIDPTLCNHNIATMAGRADGMLQSGIFEDLQRKIDEDTQIKDVCSTPFHQPPRP